MLITGLDRIREAQTIKFPTPDDVRNHFPEYTKGYVTAIFNYKANKWLYGYCESREEAVNHFEEIKEFCKQFPEAFNWLEYSEMYIYSSFGHSKAKWAILGVVVDE